MASEILYKVGTPIVIADSTYSPGSANTALGTRTDDIDVVSLGAAAARQGVKIDFGVVRAMLYDVRMTFEMAVDPTAGGTIDVYMSPSHSATPAIGNLGLLTGADAAYTGYVTLALAEALKQIPRVGGANVGINNDGDGVQMAHVGVFSPMARYYCPLVYNNTNVALHNDSIEFAVLFEPVVTETQ